MGRRGKRSANEVQTGLITVDIARAMPPPPPAELTDAQAQVWRDAAASLPGGWLSRGSIPVLVEYCRRVCRARLLEAQVARFEVEWTHVEGGLERFNQLLIMADRETKAVIAAARALRITPRSIDAKTAARRTLDHVPVGKRPWDTE